MDSGERTLFARQEIFDRNEDVIAYELLFRNGSDTESNISTPGSGEGDRATSFVLAHLFTELDFNSILGRCPAFINFTRHHLLNDIPQLLPRKRVVIEILEDTLIDEDLVLTISDLSKKGYKFALDDFIYHKKFDPLIEIVDIIKIDVLALSEKEIKAQLAALKTFKGKLLAEKVETRDHFSRCLDLGFDLFQGFFFNQPDLIVGSQISENKAFLLRLLSELHNPNIAIKRIEEIILQIPKLSYRILRLVNSVALYTGKRIESLLDAIKRLGLFQIRDWVTLMLISSLDDVSAGQLERAMIRAKMCHLLAIKLNTLNPGQAFTVGMLSTLDVILHESMESLLSKISLSEELNLALLEYKGELGHTLKLAKLYERGDFDTLDYFNFSLEDYRQAYLQSIEYSNQVMMAIS